MFNNENDRHPVPAQVALSDGRKLEGTLMLPMNVSAKRLMNSDGASVEFEAPCGTQSVISKSAIVEIMLVEEAKAKAPVAEAADHAPAAVAADQAPDPYQELGIAATASAEQVTTAYGLMKAQYNPERYANLGLPDDVLAYVTDKARRIDAAYAMIASRGAAKVAAADNPHRQAG